MGADVVIAFLTALALQAAIGTKPADAGYIKCAIGKASELGAASSEPTEVLAEEILATCTGDTDVGPRTRTRIREAAIAMIRRRRGLDGQAADAPIRVRELASFDIPDEIAPAVIPYLLCRTASSGVPVYTQGKRALVAPPPGMAKGSDCSAARAKASADADRILRQAGHADRAERAGYVEKTLSDLDKFYASSNALRSATTEQTD